MGLFDFPGVLNQVQGERAALERVQMQTGEERQKAIESINVWYDEEKKAIEEKRKKAGLTGASAYTKLQDELENLGERFAERRQNLERLQSQRQFDEIRFFRQHQESVKQALSSSVQHVDAREPSGQIARLKEDKAPYEEQLRKVRAEK